MPDLVLRTLKVSLTVLVGGSGAVMAQTQLPDAGYAGNLGLVAILALLIGRYTFRQLEDYRRDLKAARARIDNLEDALHTLGQAKAKVDRERRATEDYAHRLRAIALTRGVPLEDLPPAPEALRL